LDHAMFPTAFVTPFVKVTSGVRGPR
jgi:hypothetical protein